MRTIKSYKIFYIIFIILLISCKNRSKIEVILLDIDKATIPEGIAVDPENGNLFISSVHLDKITKSNKDGKNSIDVIPTHLKGYSAGVGLEIKQNFLFALGSINRKKESIVLQIDLENNSVVNSFELKDSIPNYFNDLAIDNNLNAYITDTEFHRIYRLDYKSGIIEVFIEHEQIKYPNGIAISEDQTKLFVDSYTSGIRIIDLMSKKILNQNHEQSAKRGIDGLKYDKQHLFAIINGGNKKEKHGLVRFKLSQEEDKILESEELLMNHPKMDIPTTLSIVNEQVYILANSQLDNLDQKNNKIIDPKQLNEICIIKIKAHNDL